MHSTMAQIRRGAAAPERNLGPKRRRDSGSHRARVVTSYPRSACQRIRTQGVQGHTRVAGLGATRGADTGHLPLVVAHQAVAHRGPRAAVSCIIRPPRLRRRAVQTQRPLAVILLATPHSPTPQPPGIRQEAALPYWRTMQARPTAGEKLRSCAAGRSTAEHRGSQRRCGWGSSRPPVRRIGALPVVRR